MNNIVNKLLVVFGFLFFAMIIYVRIIQKKEPKEMFLYLYANGNLVQILLYFAIIIAMLLCVFFNLKIITNKKKEKENKTISSILAPIKKINSSLEIFHQWLLNNTFIKKYSYTFPKWLGLNLFKYVDNKQKIVFVLLIMIILPKIIVLSSLMLDVIWVKKFNFVYKTSIILLLPLIERYFIFLIEEFCKENIKHTDEILIIQKNESGVQIFCEHYLEYIIFNIITSEQVKFNFTEQFFNKYQSVTYSVSKSLENNVSRLNTIITPIKNFELFYKIIKNEIIPKFNVILYFSYACVWSYILWCSI